MTNLNIWISNNSKNLSYGSDSQYATGRLTKVFLLTFYAFLKKIAFCFVWNTQIKKNMSKNEQRQTWQMTIHARVGRSEKRKY